MPTWFSRTPGHPRPAAVLVARLVLVPYAVALGMIVWLPAAEASKATGVVFVIAREVSRFTGADQAVCAAVFEFAANIVLFMPLGALLRWGWPRLPWWLITLIGLATTVTIESVQTMLPSRYPALSDVIANTAGAVVGGQFGATLSVARYWALRTSGGVHEMGPPTARSMRRG